MRKASNVILVGPMGSGKSAIGCLLAVRIGCDFVDVDARIEEQAGTTIATIFADEGEPAFRAREARALADAMAQGRHVVATGGGAILDAGNRVVIRGAGTVVYLQVNPHDQLLRIAGDTHRPLLNATDRGKRLAELQRQREPLYREVADVVFDTSGHTPQSAADALAAILDRSMEQTA